MNTSPRSRQEVAAAIEATALAPGTSPRDVEALCALAVDLATRAVCVGPPHVGLAVAETSGTGVLVATVAGFPSGDEPTATKIEQVRAAAWSGADEVDVVLCYRRLLAGDVDEVAHDVHAVVDAAHGDGLEVKFILETGALTPELVHVACTIVVEAGGDWVKTSTGFGPRGATVEDVSRMREAVAGAARVKAAGGIRTWDDAVALLDAGADSLGCSAPRAVLEGAIS